MIDAVGQLARWKRGSAGRRYEFDLKRGWWACKLYQEDQLIGEGFGATSRGAILDALSEATREPCGASKK